MAGLADDSHRRRTEEAAPLPDGWRGIPLKMPAQVGYPRSRAVKRDGLERRVSGLD